MSLTPLNMEILVQTWFMRYLEVSTAQISSLLHSGTFNYVRVNTNSSRYRRYDSVKSQNLISTVCNI